MSVTELGDLVGVTSPTITRQVQDLERKGLIERTSDERDGRAAIVRLSEKGLEVARLTVQARVSALRCILEGWTDEEIGQLAPVLEHLVEGLRQNGDS